MKQLKQELSSLAISASFPYAGRCCRWPFRSVAELMDASRTAVVVSSTSTSTSTAAVCRSYSTSSATLVVLACGYGTVLLYSHVCTGYRYVHCRFQFVQYGVRALPVSIVRPDTG